MIIVCLICFLQQSLNITFNLILKDIVAQADEVGGNILQFEGLGVTSGVVHGIMKLSDQQNTKLIKDVSLN